MCPDMKLALCILALAVPGCVTQPRRGIDRAGETEERRIHREVFYDNWFRPSVSEEDRDFYYRGFWKSG